MNSRQNGGQPPSDGQSPLSLLVNAADSRDASQGQRDNGGFPTGQSLADTLRLRGLTGETGPSIEEQILLQQQQQQQQAAAFGAPSPAAILSQLRDQNLLAQMGGQNPQLAALLGLTGGGGGANNADLRNALAAAQFRQQAQQPQLSHADILALSRTGALGGAPSSIFGGMGGLGSLGQAAAPGGLASELESLQRLEEIERRQRLIAAGADPLMGAHSAGPVAGAPLPAGPAAGASSRGADAPGTVRGPVIRDERIPGGHIPRPTMDTSTSSKKEASAPMVESSMPASETEGKEDIEKTPGSVIVPCRARGMPMDHNFKTAYFVIPENVKHGEELICSYFACRNAGIKFRYCSHCKVPVAKRNFRKRHKHGGNEVADIPDDDSGAEDECKKVPAKRGIPSQITAKTGGDADALSANSAESNDKEEMVRSTIRDHEAKKDSKPSAAAKGEEENPKINAERRERWGTLLGRRPATKDGDSMSSWLMEVLAVSDLDTPLKTADEMDLKPKAETKELAAAVAMAAGDSKKPAASSDAAVAASTVAAAAAAAAGVKKKRPANFEEAAAGTSNASDAFAKGSFAAWKERKRQKKQAKMNPGQTEEV
eukprot:CAMPEP_0172455234 /NCGR_PEP_ID=MMETSP1065-20121228/11965_1 /TAXON_ID=265537 /ORGANISM="Amphiprora paludosa, Strain CCMP125" /LENGTH=599 /DNA_ID=CAMNT_0013207693 /DNA_START=121 /DNA_END=1920 /DNA_ORIENTATION=-